MYMSDYERQMCQDQITLIEHAMRMMDRLPTSIGKMSLTDQAALVVAKMALLEQCRNIRKAVAEHEREEAEEEAEYA